MNCLKKLFRKKDSLVEQKIKNPLGVRGARVIGVMDAIDLKLFTHEYMQSRMETLIYDGLVSDDDDADKGDIHKGSLKQWEDIDKKYPEFTKMLMIHNEIYGFLTFLVLNDECFELAKQGKLCEGDITLDVLDRDIVNNSEGYKNEFKGYFLDIVIESEHRNASNFRLLLDAFIKQIEDYAKAGKFVVEWCANGYSEHGIKLCEMLGLEFICNHEQEGEGQIYHTKFNEDSFNHRGFKRYPHLVELYQKHFKDKTVNK